MVQPTRASFSPAAADAGERLPRCCTRHPDWPTLSQHLVDEFPELAPADIVREVGRAKEAVEHVRLDLTEALAVGELIARHQLLMLSGRVTEAARLDPERHDRLTKPRAGS